ncbi:MULTISPECIES: hypothetical protein [Nonomuraea]|uniref:Uncharacterized protein n=1 Tax=Nonomuraea mangrovi TaxID=2316207 RepID=A0ABW4SVJ8_9ACTN
MGFDLWLPFLKCWGRQWPFARLAAPRSAFEQSIIGGLPAFSPISEGESDAAEMRLGCAFTPSLRALLPAINDRRYAGLV